MRIPTYSLTLALTTLIALGTTAKANLFDINGTTAGFGVADGGSYDWLGGTFWNSGTDAAADAGTAATAAWTPASSAYFVGAGADTNYTVRLGSDGSSNVSVLNLGLNMNAAASGALAGAAGNVTIGNSGDTGILSLSNSNSVGAQAGATLTINNGINLGSRTLNFRGGNVVINGVISGTTGKYGFGAAWGLTTGTLTLANTANTFAGRTSTDYIPANYTLAVTKLADSGQNSSIGNSTAQIGMNGGTLKYIGTGAQSTNLGLNIAGTGSTIDASGATSADTITFAGTTSAFDGSKILTLAGSNKGANTIAFDLGNTGGTANRVIKSGVGTWVLSGNNTLLPGSYTISAGMLQFAKTASLYGSDTAKWTAGNIRVNSGGTFALNVGGTDEFTTGNVTTLLTNLAASTSTSNGMNAGSNFGFDTTNASGGTFTIANNIANTTGTSGGARGLTKLGTGTLILSGTNTYNGTTTVSAGTLLVSGGGLTATSGLAVSDGTLQLGASNVLNDVALTLSGGTFSTGATTGFNETLGILNIDTAATLTLALGTGVHSLNFADSHLIDWSGSTLTITGWTGTAGASGTAGKIFFGNSAAGLATAQLSQINFTGYTNGAAILSTGEIVAVPEPTTWALLAFSLTTVIVLRRRRPQV